MPRMIAPMLALMGLIFLLTGAGVVISSHAKGEDFISAKAVVYANFQTDGINSVKPVVELEIDGRIERHSCQAVSRKHYNARPGDTVNVLYRQKQFLGMRTIQLFYDSGEQPQIRAQRFVSIAGGILIAVGVAILAVAFKMYTLIK